MKQLINYFFGHHVSREERAWIRKILKERSKDCTATETGNRILKELMK